MSLELLTGIVAGICTGISLLPQLIKMLKEKSTTGISLPMLIILFLGVSLWIVYGLMKTDWPIIITNGFSLLINLLILFFRWHFKHRGAQ